MDWMQDAIEQVIAASRPGWDGKLDAIPYYQKEYQKKGKGGWKQHLIQDLLGAKDVRPDIDKTEYQRQYKNLSKRFDSGAKGGKEPRLYKPEPKTAKEYQQLALAKGIRKAPPGGYHVHYEGGIQFSECEQRSFDVDITGELADEVAAHPDRVIQIAIMVYMQQEGEDEEGIPGPCGEEGEPEVSIYANPDDFKANPVKRHKPARAFFR